MATASFSASHPTGRTRVDSSFVTPRRLAPDHRFFLAATLTTWAEPWRFTPVTMVSVTTLAT